MVIIETPIDGSNDDYYGSRRRSFSGSGPLAEVSLGSNEEWLNSVLRSPKRLHYSSRDKLHFVDSSEHRFWGGTDASLGLQALHQAFQAHHNYGLRPDTVWYMIIGEVAEHVRQNANRYASLFTDTPESKHMIEVRDDSLRYDAPSDWGRTINLFHDPLTEKITQQTADLFLPKFSTTTVEDETALLVALMDAASPYYEYKVSTMCGIPKIRLEGDAADWHKVQDQASQLAANFGGLEAYFADLIPVLGKFAGAAEGENDTHFWRSIYKFGGGSGGPYVTGWFTSFFAHIATDDGLIPKEEDQIGWQRMLDGWGGFTTDEFPAHISKVPFIWNYFDTEYEMSFAAGITGVDFDDEFLTPRLGFAVAEV